MTIISPVFQSWPEFRNDYVNIYIKKGCFVPTCVGHTTHIELDLNLKYNLICLSKEPLLY